MHWPPRSGQWQLVRDCKSHDFVRSDGSRHHGGHFSLESLRLKTGEVHLIDSDEGRTNRVTRTPISVAVLLLFSAVDIAARQGALAVDRAYEQLAREIFQELIGTKTTESGVGTTPAAEALAQRLHAAGSADRHVQVIVQASENRISLPDYAGQWRSRQADSALGPSVA
jgi:hypothetical protein